jgi:hypothetical protein
VLFNLQCKMTRAGHEETIRKLEIARQS